MHKPRLLIFASGSKDGGGSGFENLVNATIKGVLDADIIGVVSNHKNGGVKEKALRLDVPFIYLPDNYTAEVYKHLAKGADFVALSGWLKLVRGLDPRTTFNIHPGPLPQFGGPRMYGHHVHEAVMEAYRRGEVTESAISMHFVTDEYDKGPVFFSKPVPILDNDTAESLATRVNAYEHRYQPLITQSVIHGKICWDGVNPESLFVPE